MALAHVLGFPRIGAQRELKQALEAFWRSEVDAASLLATGAELRERHWALQHAAGLDHLTAGDFAHYDQMLDLSLLLGALPARFGFDPRNVTLAQTFELARGNAQQPAMEMTKWFDTNYHYLVPELDANTTFDGGSERWFDDVAEAVARASAVGQSAASVKPVLIGPVTYLWLAKTHVAGFDRLSLLPSLIAAYERILGRLRASGIEWVQIDEPALCLELEPRWLAAIDQAYARLGVAGPKLLLATYFESVADHVPQLVKLPVHGFHIDLVRAPEQLGVWRAALPETAVLSAGIVDGRNVWRTDLRRALGTLSLLHKQLGDRLWVASSCSLLHVPVSLESERKLDAGVRPWLAFAVEKLTELGLLKQALNEGEAAVAEQLAASDVAQQSRRNSKRVVNELVRKRVAAVTEAMVERQSAFKQRIAGQQQLLQLPPLPTTTIGSFPQTATIRQTRAAYKRGELSALDYLTRIRGEIELAVRKQEALGLDVLVHGEAERNDMVEYFGEQLWGYVFSDNGWVQSYGSRCVKPPILYGDIYRPEPMTVETTRYAQSLTGKPMKGMLTGPVTMLQWSFVRDDQPRRDTAM
ncbi:MAG: 5-methyltetrahydropteroyltriglutamate--homocysteine S-methyltransferase, partial [Rhizobacter sp.]|nr:5-methyltetrahydropteroyltriglutamate--homocysteine S-methyltransferase [Rhizobacter sp.]